MYIMYVMYVCMYVWIYVYMRIYVSIDLCNHEYLYTCVQAHNFICIFAHLSISTSVYVLNVNVNIGVYALM